MLHMFRKAARITALAGIASLGISTAASGQATASATGLGQAWPNAADGSADPHWHVYVFARDGIRYIQINDSNGTVHAAVGNAGGQIFSLPVGVDAQRVNTSATASVSAAKIIYRDSAMTVMAAPQDDGTLQFVAQPSPCSDPGNCAGGMAFGGSGVLP